MCPVPLRGILRNPLRTKVLSIPTYEAACVRLKEPSFPSSVATFASKEFFPTDRFEACTPLFKPRVRFFSPRRIFFLFSYATLDSPQIRHSVFPLSRGYFSKFSCPWMPLLLTYNQTARSFHSRCSEELYHPGSDNVIFQFPWFPATASSDRPADHFRLRVKSISRRLDMSTAGFSLYRPFMVMLLLSIRLLSPPSCSILRLTTRLERRSGQLTENTTHKFFPPSYFLRTHSPSDFGLESSFSEKVYENGRFSFP